MVPDPLELMPEVVKGAATVGGKIPFTGIVKRMLGPAADEVAEMLRDQVRVYRYGRQLKLLEKAERMAQDAGFTPQAVPPKILFPLLEGASFEDDEDLHTMWAALLANAASPNDPSRVRPGFVATLRQLSPDEAAVLSLIFDYVSEAKTPRQSPLGVTVPVSTLLELCSSLGLGEVKRRPGGSLESLESDTLGTCMDSLVAAQLIARRYDSPIITTYALTYRGYDFVTACRPPKPKAGAATNPE